MKHRARWIALSAGLVVTVFAVVLATQVGTDPRADANKSHLLGANAPSIDLPTLDGGRLRTSDLAGKVVIVNFWNSWCIPCRQEEPALKSFYAAHRADADFAMVGIVRDDEPAPVRAYIAGNKIDWPVAFDPKGSAGLGFGTTGQPETYVIGPSGVAACGSLGPVSAAELEAWLQVARSGGVCA